MSQARKRSNIVPLTADPRARNALKYLGEEHCRLVKSMARNGEFPEQWCAKIGIAMSTMYNWANRYVEFDEACQLAWVYLTAFWTQQTVEAARGGAQNTKLLMEILKKRFPDTWGYNPRNIQANFPTRWSCIPETDSESSCSKREDEVNSEDLKAELEMLRKRHGFS